MKRQIVRIILGSALAMAVTLPVTRVAYGDHDYKEDCHRRLESDKAKVDEAASKHGEHSRQVDKAVDKLEADRQWCRDHHADWDHNMFDIGIYLKH
jgi:hypothetical protein